MTTVGWCGSAAILQVLGILGAPDATVPGNNGEILRYDRLGISVFVSADRLLTMIAMSAAAAGNIESVRARDPTSVALSKWGAPIVSSQGDWFFHRGGWSIFLKPQGDLIQIRGIGLRSQ